MIQAMTPFQQFLYIYGLIYAGYAIYSCFFVKPSAGDAISFEDQLSKALGKLSNPSQMTADTVKEHFDDLGKKVSPVASFIPLEIMNIVWIIMGLYTDQWAWFVLFFVISGYEFFATVFLKSIPKSVVKYSGFTLRMALVGAIYYFKFFA